MEALPPQPQVSMNRKHVSCAAQKFLFCFFMRLQPGSMKVLGLIPTLAFLLESCMFSLFGVLLTYPGVRSLKTCEVDKGAALVWVSEPCDGRARPLAALMRRLQGGNGDRN